MHCVTENGLKLRDLFKNPERLIQYLSEKVAVLPRKVVDSLLDANFNGEEVITIFYFIQSVTDTLLFVLIDLCFFKILHHS